MPTLKNKRISVKMHAPLVSHKVKEDVKHVTNDVKHLLTAVETKLVRRIHEKPSKDALDKLAMFVGYQNWESFQQELHEGDLMEEGGETIAKK